MHPIERLRYVARSTGVPASDVVEHTAAALADFEGDPHGLVTASQRVVARQPGSAPLVWFTARVLSAADPSREIAEARARLRRDPTSAALEAALPDGATVVVVGGGEQVGPALARRADVTGLFLTERSERSERFGWPGRVWSGAEVVEVPPTGLGAAAASADLVLIEAGAIAPDEFLAESGSRAAAAVARHAGRPVWLVGGVGRTVPSAMWGPMRARIEAISAEPWDASEEIVPLELVDIIVGPEGPSAAEMAANQTDCPVALELFRGVVM